MVEAGTKGLGRKVAIGLAAALLGYVLLIAVFPRVLDGYQYHALSDRLVSIERSSAALSDRLASIERSFAVLLDRTGARPDTLVPASPMEASLAANRDSLGERALAEQLESMTRALGRLEAAVQAQTRALEALAPRFEPIGIELDAGDGK